MIDGNEAPAAISFADDELTTILSSLIQAVTWDNVAIQALISDRIDTAEECGDRAAESIETIEVVMQHALERTRLLGGAHP